MNWLHTSAIIVHVLIASAIVGLVLLQRGKGADAGAGFGSGASGTVFGARGSASFLSRTTATLAALFFATNLALAYMGGRKSETVAPTSVVDRVQQQTTQAPPLPETPAAAAPSVEQPAAEPATQAPEPEQK